MFSRPSLTRLKPGTVFTLQSSQCWLHSQELEHLFRFPFLCLPFPCCPSNASFHKYPFSVSDSCISDCVSALLSPRESFYPRRASSESWGPFKFRSHSSTAVWQLNTCSPIFPSNSLKMEISHCFSHGMDSWERGSVKVRQLRSFLCEGFQNSKRRLLMHRHHSWGELFAASLSWRLALVPSSASKAGP